ncbi:MAG TPA: pectate lyase [Opitutus sp.]|nr:pectate lyase [Opitutus sp.]
MSPRFAACAIACGFLPSLAPAARPPRPWPPNPFAPLTAARIAALPAAERAAWQDYWDASDKLVRAFPERPVPDASPPHALAGPPKGGLHTKGLRLNAPAAWYATGAARTIADRVATAQFASGGWTKGLDYTRASPPPAPEPGTFDNDATIFELRFLARVIAAAGAADAAVWRAAFDRGLRYVFAAQYPNGGFPQYYPLRGGYHDGVTFNDDAMVHVLELLQDVAAGRGDYAFVTPPDRAEAADRLARGVACVLATQLHGPSGEPTAWCQQYDPLTLRAAAARNFEPIADCARESASIVLFLMSRPDPSPSLIAAVDGAVAWFRATALHDLRVERAPADTRGETVPAPGAPPLWARYYEPGTATPIFGDRDRTIHYDLTEVSPERIAGYSWYTDAPASVLKHYNAWQRRVRAAPR